MKKKIVTIAPFLIMPIFTPIYCVLDNLILVEIFGCGCVPSVQTNMFNSSFNANDLRVVVFSTLTISLFIWSIGVSKNFKNKIAKLLYCLAVLLVNAGIAIWVTKTFMWG